ncbi:hypothetical protein SAMN03159338_1533 [Sphingomonas sp. NFR04]|jgi:hypothetical protein|uniref:hypothetical protein n=1 Tax=Sphingomonas sp. NFR04 TaxID=1566283 RepID=UPI0008E11975|nr:hypothetical protein [Sphingomonas sp. NFR04]SFJ48753.1 hypothetical protein SAMN03159338_1533 [Sphingomonas sp. NFR04]
MARFQIDFEREVIQVDRVTRVIEASSPQHAREIAALMACEFDSSCPDDVTMSEEGSGECQEWMVHAIEVTTGPLTEEDEGEEGFA